jgi:hypothetical protein
VPVLVETLKGVAIGKAIHRMILLPSPNALKQRRLVGIHPNDEIDRFRDLSGQM